MLEAFFEAVWAMTKTTSAVIIVVLIARAILKNAPKKFSYALWAVVLFRLLCPMSIETPFSPLSVAPVTLALPAAGPEERPLETVQTESRASPDRQDGAVSVPQSEQRPNTAPEEHTSAPAQTGALPASPGYTFEPAPPSPLHVREFIVQNRHTIAARVWLLGAAGLLGYSAVSLLRLRRRLVGAVPWRERRGCSWRTTSPLPSYWGCSGP